MLPAQSIGLLRRWESAFPVATWKVGGVHVWPLLRQHLGIHLILQEAVPERPKVRGTPEVRALEALELAKTVVAHARDRAKDVRRVSGAEVVFLSRPINRARVGEVWYDRFFDPIADLLEERSLRTLTLEYHEHGTEYRLPRRRPSLLIRPRVSFEQLKAAVRRRAARPPSFEGYDALARAVRAEGSLSAPEPGRLLERMWAILYTARAFERWLSRARPRLVLVSCYYNLVGMALCLAARRRGVPSVDVQHGVLHQNPAYDGWTAFPAEGYSLLPDRFWCWSRRDTEPFDGWPAAARALHSPVAGGHPWQAFFEGPDRAGGAFVEQIQRIKGPFNVLVSLSNSSGLSEVIRRTLLAAPRDWSFWIRLHPRMDSERRDVVRWIREHVGPRAQVEIPTDLPLPLLLRHADVHMAHNSTVLQEAAAAGLPSVAVDRRSLDTFAAEVASGWVAHAEGDAILPALVSQGERRSRLPTYGAYPSRREMAETLFGLLG